MDLLSSITEQWFSTTLLMSEREIELSNVN